MRRFAFRLETVLKHRENIEEICEQEFASIQGAVQAVERRVLQLTQEMRQTVLSRPDGSPGEPLDAPSLLNRERYIAILQDAVANMEQRLEAARILMEEKRLALVAARQAREAVSKLREKDLAEYTAMALKLEQDALDELATLRYARSMRSDAFDKREKEAA